MEIVFYGTDGKILEVLTVTTENPKAAICYEAGKCWQAFAVPVGIRESHPLSR